MAEFKKSPEIWFAGFTDEWREVELGEILTERNELQKISEDAPILAFASGQGVIDRSERRSNNRDHLTLDQENKIYKLTEPEDIVYNPSNLKYGAIDRNKHGRGVISPIYVTFTTKEEPSFIERIVKSEKFKLRALQYEEGTVVKRQSVKPENLLSLKINLPKSKKEQKEIGVLFDKLESSIVNHTKKYEKLLKLKKAMLVKMYPQNDALVPEIRFKGFDKKWEKKQLNSICDIVGGGTPNTSNPEYWDGQIDWFSPTEIGENPYANMSQRKITQSGLESSSAIILPANKTVLFTSRAGIGKMAILTKEASTNQGFQSLILNDLIDTYFIYSSGYLIKKFALSQASGSTFLEISSKVLGKMILKIPDEDEQKKIGLYFKKLDETISLYQRKIEKLKTIKKAFLNKLFIS